MKLIVENVVYDVRFNSYDQVYGGRIKPLKNEIVPTTQIYLAWDNGAGVVSCMATAFCSPKDEYDEKKGRKVALERALNHMWPPYTVEEIKAKPELKSLDDKNKAKRGAFWKEYITYKESATK
jgi:hypothetical protein